MTTKVFDAVLSVVDEGSAGVLKLDQNLKGLSASAVVAEGELKATGHAAEVAGAEMKSAGHKVVVANEELKMSGFERAFEQISEGALMARERIGGVAERMAFFKESLVDVLPMLAGFAAVSSIGGIAESIHHTAELAEALEVAATKAGISTQELQGLEFAAKQVGVPADGLVNSFGKLNKTIGDTVRGKNKDALALFHALGIDLKTSNGHIKDAAEIMPALEDAFRNTSSPAMRAAMAVKLFGKAGLDMLPLLDLGSKKVAEIQQKFAKFGYVFSDKDKEGLEQFNSAWKDLEASAGGFMDELGAKLGPALAPGLEGMALWISRNREWIATDMAGAVRGVEEATDKIGPAARRVADIFKKFLPPVKGVWDTFEQGIVHTWQSGQWAFDSYEADVMAGLNAIKKFTSNLPHDGSPRRPDTVAAIVKAEESGGPKGDVGGAWWYDNVIAPLLKGGERSATEQPSRYYNAAAPSVIEVAVRFENTPPGTVVNATSKAPGVPVRLRLGYNSMTGHN